MTDGSIRVIARVTALPGKEAELRELLESLVEPTRAESGCRAYDLLLNEESPEDFTFVEEWANPAALESHMATEHFSRVIGQLDGLIDGLPDLRRYRQIR